MGIKLSIRVTSGTCLVICCVEMKRSRFVNVGDYLGGWFVGWGDLAFFDPVSLTLVCYGTISPVMWRLASRPRNWRPFLTHTPIHVTSSMAMSTAPLPHPPTDKHLPIIAQTMASNPMGILRVKLPEHFRPGVKYREIVNNGPSTTDAMCNPREMIPWWSKEEYSCESNWQFTDHFSLFGFNGRSGRWGNDWIKDSVC